MNRFIAICAIGCEKVLGNEIKKLGLTLTQDKEISVQGHASFLGDNDAIYKANIGLRTAERIYLVVAQFQAQDFDELFEGVNSVSWQDLLKKDVKLVVDKVRTHSNFLASEHSIQSIVHKAIYQKLQDKFHLQRMAETGSHSCVRVYINAHNIVTILLDLSGEPLNIRGYRKQGGIAPLKETTAASLLQTLLYRRKTPLLDVFCGSGTIAIEAMLYAYNAFPLSYRSFSYEALPFYNHERDCAIRKDFQSQLRLDIHASITGSDIAKSAIELAIHNAQTACKIVGGNIKIPDFRVADFRNVTPNSPQGLLFSNPPYGIRMGDAQQAKELYHNMTPLLKTFENWTVALLTSAKDFEKDIGKYADSKKAIISGSVSPTLYTYKAKGI